MGEGFPSSDQTNQNQQGQTYFHDRVARRRSATALAAVMAGAIGAAAVSSVATADAASSYHEMHKPLWAPPAWLFGPVWSVLYVMMALAGWRIWVGNGTVQAITLWWLQLALNAAWTPTFFTAGLWGPALAILLALDAIIIWLVITNWRHRTPSLLLMPYLAWLLYATALTGAVILLNR